MLTLCAPDDPRLAETAAELRALDAEIRAGQRSLEENAAALGVLLAQDCMALARAESTPSFESAEALSLWWDAGGERWLRSFVDPADRPYLVLPPDPRPAPTLGCSPQTPDCGAEARVWTMEANIAMTRHSERQAQRSGLSVEACADTDYARWYACVDRASRRVGVLPLRAATPPDTGWLVVRGTRGSCEILQVYSLPTGDATLVRRCAATPERPAESTAQAGKVSEAQLEELVWFLFVGPDVGDALRTEALILPLPEGMARTRERAANDATISTQSWSTNQSALTWAFNGPDPALTRSGTITWPWSTDPSEDYTDRLLLAVERSFVEGCPAPPPTNLRVGRLAGEPETTDPGGLPLDRAGALESQLYGFPVCPP